MIDWLLIWGATQAAGFAFKPILEELAKDATKDWVKDMFKGSLSNVIKLPQKEPLEKAGGKALKEFLALFQQELEDAELENEQVKEYLQPLKKFISLKAVKEILGMPIQENDKGINIQMLDQLWETYHLKDLPNEFNWSQLSKRYVRKVRAILIEDEELRQILDSQNLERIADNNNTEIKTDFSLIKHQETIRERYQNLPLDGLDHSIQDRRIPLWDIFIVQNVRLCQEYLPKVYELPKEYQLKLKKSGQLEEYTQEKLYELERFYSSQVNQSVLEVIEGEKSAREKQNNYYVILGDPGSGKSTLLKYLAIKWTELPAKELTVKPIPLLIELRDYAQSLAKGICHNFLEFTHKSPNWVGHLNQHDLHENLSKGNGLVMFDGLDEVFDIGQRQTIIKQIHDLTQDYPQIKVIVTSRNIGYEPSAFRDANFSHYMIQDLDETQIEEFNEKWHNLVSENEQDKQRFQQKLKEGIETSRAIKELAGNPLLLTMMAILNKSQELPRDRAELYHQCSRILLYQWDIGRTLIEDSRIDYKTFDYKDKQAMCRQIAYFMQSKEKGLAGNIISEEDLEKLLRDYLTTIGVNNAREIGKVMIHQLRHRNFMLCSLGVIGQEGHYGFVHRTFLEYFCAWEFVWRFEKDKTLSLEELKNSVFGKHWQDESWHEVLRLICGMIEPKFAGEMIEYLMDLDGEKDYFMNLFLGADCLSEVRNRQEINKIDKKLLTQVKSVVEIHYGNIQEIINNDNNIAKLQQPFKMLDNAMEKIAIIWQDSAYLKKCVVDDLDEVIKVTAMEQLVQKFGHDSDTLEFIKTRAIDDPNFWVRSTTIGQLVQQFRDNSDMVEFIKTCAVGDPHEGIRYMVIQLLVNEFGDDSDMVEFIKTRAVDDLGSNVRSLAIELLAHEFQDNSDTLKIIKTHAVNDPDCGVRSNAIKLLAHEFQDNSDTLKIIKIRAVDDSNWIVRSTAIEELAQQFRDDSDTVEFIKTCAINDPFQREKDAHTNPRQTALKYLVELFPKHPQLKDILQDRLENDPDEEVRKYVQSVIDKI